MSGEGCESSSLVEANFDGRLWPAEKASIERHLRTCATCRELLEELTRLRETMPTIAKPITPLHHQRARLSLLRAATTPEKKRRPTWLLAVAIVMVPVAVWAGITEGLRPRQVVTIGAGSMSFEASSVQPLPVAPRVVIPDVAPSTAPAASSSAPPFVPPPAASISPASQSFNAAMEAIERGDFGAGASQLERFAERYPHDPRVEEALYLDAIALERAGRVGEAKVAARRYLDAYPAGAHRSRAAKLASDQNIPKAVEPGGQ